MTKRAGICVNVDGPEEVRGVEEWFKQWRSALSHLSENEGCGCCVNIWYVEGPEEAIRDIHEASRVFRGDLDAYWSKHDAR
jgi:hypothetical protein